MRSNASILIYLRSELHPKISTSLHPHVAARNDNSTSPIVFPHQYFARRRSQHSLFASLIENYGGFQSSTKPLNWPGNEAATERHHGRRNGGLNICNRCTCTAVVIFPRFSYVLSSMLLIALTSALSPRRHAPTQSLRSRTSYPDHGHTHRANTHSCPNTHSSPTSSASSAAIAFCNAHAVPQFPSPSGGPHSSNRACPPDSSW